VPEYLYPGVYGEEIDARKSIEGVPTSTGGFLGWIRCSLGASVKIAAVLVFGVSLEPPQPSRWTCVFGGQDTILRRLSRQLLDS
jgi:hypothetical protein